MGLMVQRAVICSLLHSKRVCLEIMKFGPDGERMLINGNNNNTNNLNNNVKKEKLMLENNCITNEDKTTIIKFANRVFTFEIGSKLLSKWYDGLFHPAVVLQVNQEAASCHVAFDNECTCWVPVYDLQWPAPPAMEDEEELQCCLCHTELSLRPNQIVICDGCGLGFHQQCHHPLISKEIIRSDADWFCTLCVHSNATKPQKQEVGSQRQVSRVKPVVSTKKVISYNLRALHWNEAHTSNQEQCYCYCGGSGQWYVKMVQCQRCQQWFHEACLSVRPDRPLLLGDTNFLLVCGVCNSGGGEVLVRCNSTWVDLVHLAVFNLSLSRSKYSDYDLDIMPWVNNRWSHLASGPLADTPVGSRFMNVLNTLRDNTDRFKSGSETKKKSALFCLRCRSPPLPPTVSLPPERNLSQAAVRAWLARDNHMLTRRLSPAPVVLWSRCPTLLTMVKKRRRTGDDLDSSTEKPPATKRRRKDKHSAGDSFVLPPTPSPTPSGGSLNLPGGFPSADSLATDHTPPQTEAGGGRRKKRRRRRCRNTLRRCIPAPAEFSGADHPFLTALERQTLLAREKSRQHTFDLFTAQLPHTLLPATADLDTSTTKLAATLFQQTPEVADQPRCVRRGRKPASASKPAANGDTTKLPIAVATRGMLGSGGDTASILEECIYVGDALEHDDFQIRASRLDEETGQLQYLVEWYDDMDLFRK